MLKKNFFKGLQKFLLILLPDLHLNIYLDIKINKLSSYIIRYLVLKLAILKFRSNKLLKF